jgi:hypothetical protein
MKSTEPVNILVVDDMPEKILAIEATLGELGQNIVKALFAQGRFRRDFTRCQHAGNGRV